VNSLLVISSDPLETWPTAGLALIGTVCCTSQRPAKSICFGSRSAANNIDGVGLDQDVSDGQFIEDTVEPSSSCPGLSPCSSCV